MPYKDTTKLSHNEQSAVQVKGLHRMESFWRLCCNRRTLRRGLIENPALVYLRFLSHLGLAHCDIYDSGLLDEPEKIHLAEPPESLGFLILLIIAEIFLRVSAVFNIDFITSFIEGEIFRQDFNAQPGT